MNRYNRTSAGEQCWRVLPQTLTVELLRLTPDGPVMVAAYGSTQSLQSLTFPDLIVPVTDLFQA
jgi:hypothetical protein